MKRPEKMAQKNKRDLGAFLYRFAHRILDTSRDMLFNPLSGKSPLDPPLDAVEETMSDGFDLVERATKKRKQVVPQENRSRHALKKRAKEQELELEFLAQDKQHRAEIRKQRLKQMEQLRDQQQELELVKEQSPRGNE